MRAEVIAIGDEMTSGQRVDTNSAWLSQRLGELGVVVQWHTTVGDDLADNISVFRTAIERADVVVATGGLGPTADDLTREAVAAAIASELVLDEEALKYIEALFARRARTMPEKNRLQAMRPAASQMISNPQGTAPGLGAEVARPGRSACQLFALPGVPVEMIEMWNASVAPALASLVGSGTVIRHRNIKCFGVGESHLESMLPDLIRRGREPRVGITVHGATITLRITATGSTVVQCDSAIESTVRVIREALGDLVYGEGDDELSDAVVRLLTAAGRTLATAECGTAGRLARWLAESARSAGAGALVAESYRGGLVMPQFSTLDAISDLQALVSQMAVNCRRQFNADYGLAIGPLPLEPNGPDPAEFHIALAKGDAISVKTDNTAGHPAILQDRTAKQALDFFRRMLLGETTQ